MKALSETTIEELDALIAAQELLHPSSKDMSDDVEHDLLLRLNESGFPIDRENILNYRSMNSICACMGVSDGYVHCHCRISSLLDTYKFKIAKMIKTGEI